MIHPQIREPLAPFKVVWLNDSITVICHNAFDDFVFGFTSDGEVKFGVDANHWGFEVLEDETCGGGHHSAVDYVLHY